MKHQTWTTEKIKAGFDRFLEENGRLPMSLELETLSLDYLPNRKYIERHFGGIEKLKISFGYSDAHFGRGEFRSKIALKANKKGREEELKLEKILVEKFGEVFVHTEKIFDDTKNRVDFYVYSPSGNFGIDIFYTETMHSLGGNINIKLNKYSNYKERLFFVVAGNSFTQEELDAYVLNKTRRLPALSEITTIERLKMLVNKMTAYPNPLT